MSARRPSLLSRLVGCLSLLSRVMVEIVGATTGLQARRVMQTALFEWLDATLSLKQAALGLWIETQQKMRLKLAHPPKIQQALQTLIDSPDPDPTVSRSLASHLRTLQISRPELRQILRLSPQGQVVVSTDPEQVGLTGQISDLALLRAGLPRLIAYGLVRRITDPIRWVTEAATQIAAGDLTPRAPIMTQDEVGRLVQAFNRMTERLQGLYRELADQVLQTRIPEDSLRRSEANNRALIEASPDLMLRLNHNGIHLERHGPHHFKTPLPWDAQIGKSLHEVLPPMTCWQTWQPHLIWMDIRRPGGDGFEVTRQIRSLPQSSEALSSPMIIALITNAFPEDRAAVLAAGGDDFLCKPFRELEIWDKLTQHLGIQFHCKDPVTEENQAGITSQRAAGDGLRPEDLQDLPQDWIHQLHQAGVDINLKHLHQVSHQIQAWDPQVADRLDLWVSQYRFEELQTLLLQVRSP